MIGHILDDFEITADAGPANYGHLYRARRNGVDLLLKILDQGASDYEFRRLSNEIRVHAELGSKHLANVVTAGFCDGVLYYAMEPYDGTLAQPGDFDTLTRIRAVAGAARGAHDLHGLGIAHRDIRPATIAVDKADGRLIDLGLAQVLPGAEVSLFGPRGTVDFLAPEVAHGEPATPASDVWALGLTLHRVMSSAPLRPPAPAGSLLDHLRHAVAHPPQIDARLPPSIIGIIEVCTDDAERRWATASDLADALDGVCNDTEVITWRSP
jgi:serine/threonine protein kinase